MKCQYHGRDNIEKTITLSIDGKVYDYYFQLPCELDAAEYLLVRFPGKGLAFTKRYSLRCVRRVEA